MPSVDIVIEANPIYLSYSPAQQATTDVVLNNNPITLEYVENPGAFFSGTIAWGSLIGSLPNQSDLVDYVAAAIAEARPRRVISITSGTSVTIDCSITDDYEIKQLASDVTFNAPANLTDGKMVLVRLVDNGLSRNITLNSIFVDVFGQMSASTTPGKVTFFGFRYCASRGKCEILQAETEQ